LYCEVCRHNHEYQVNNVIRGDECPYCSIKPKLCGREDCKHCYSRSFAATPRGKYWSSKNKFKPWQVAKSSGKKFLLDCPDCDTCFPATLNSITSRGTFCPNCYNKTEKLLLEHLNDACDEEITREATLSGCGDKRPFRYDCMIKKWKLILELDGEQHFENVSFFKTMDLEENQKRDQYKTAFAVNRGYTVLRMLRMDVWENRNNWKDRLKVHLRAHKKPRAILMDEKARKYDPLRKLLDDSETDYTDA
jgi:very-short-patch-repair endonuclease